MRQVHLWVSEDQRQAAAEVLEDHGVDYVTTDGEEAAETGTVFLFPLPTEAVSSVFDDLESEGIDVDEYTVVTSAETIATAHYEEVQNKHSSLIRGLARSEIHSKVREMQWPRLTYYVGTILSVVAATVGLLVDSPAIIIGSMVIAPQVSSAISADVAVLLGDWDMFVDSVRRQAFGLAVAIVAAAAFAWFAKWASLVPPTIAVGQFELMGLRWAPTGLTIIAALVAGAVGAFGFTTEQSMSIVGVMIAAAIVPAAAAVGIAVTWDLPVIAIGALLLLAVNVFAINVGAFVTLVAMGYRPEWSGNRALLQGIDDGSGRKALAVAVVLLVAFAGTAYFSGQYVSFNRSVNNEVTDTLSESPYSDLTLTRVQAQYPGSVFSSNATNVTVVVTRSPNASYPKLSSTLERRIERRTGRNVLVNVQFTTSSSSTSSSSHAGNRSSVRAPFETASSVRTIAA